MYVLNHTQSIAIIINLLSDYSARNGATDLANKAFVVIVIIPSVKYKHFYN